MPVVVILRNATVFCRAMELQGKGTTPAHLAPLLTTQAETIAATTAFKSAIHRPPAKHALGPAASTLTGLWRPAAPNAATAAEAEQVTAVSSCGGTRSTSVAGGSPPVKRTPKRRSSVAASAR